MLDEALLESADLVGIEAGVGIGDDLQI